MDALSAIALAVVAVSVAVLFRFAVPAVGERPLLLLSGAVLFCACVAGAQAAIPAIAMSVAAASYFFLPPPGLAIDVRSDAAPLLLFVLEGVLVTVVCDRVRDAHQGARRAAREAERAVAARSGAERVARRLETGTAALDRLGVALAAELPPREAAMLAAQVSASVSNADWALFEFRRHGSSERTVASVGRVPAGSLDAAWEELAARAARERVYRVEDLRHDPSLAKLYTAEHPLRSLLVAAVEGRSGRGLLCLGHPVPARFDEQHQLLLGVLAGQAAAALDNAHHHADALQAQDEAQHAARMKDEFLSTLSHELRTPLNAIVGWAHLLQGRKLGPDDTHRAIETIVRNASLQESMIGELLDMSSLLNGRLRLSAEPLDLRRVVENAVGTARGYAHAKMIDLQLAVAADPVTVTGDADRLQQVVWSLLSNAIKFTPAGGRVHVRVGVRDGRGELQVADDGAGMDAQFLARLFSRFSRADGSSTRPTRGLGLGLSVARGLVELHDGQITAESGGIGLGATFTVRLPLSVHSADSETAGRAFAQSVPPPEAAVREGAA